ncbi:M48 family metallopeptidase [Microaerobacter geothermalis]|uniref:M48 family metallopeptidase n=1 Tax=Microaerobacter geothermalis TaxID=674972 RepID=UPI001F18D9A4|nr:M48 family metallopeptidase [Microaerobacter geothermalis]MCF6093004.1 M48 family metallopeptidase [Microaerobacter geothermalis]
MRIGWFKWGLYLLFLIVMVGLLSALYSKSPDPSLYPPPANPATFMSEEQLNKSIAYSKGKYALFFIGHAYTWLVLLFILMTGMAKYLQRLAERMSARFVFQAAFFSVFLFGVIFLFDLPLGYLAYLWGKRFGLTTQPLEEWLLDNLKNLGIGLIIIMPLVWLFYLLIRKKERTWWIWVWLVSIPVAVFLIFIQPVVIDPLFNQFKPIQNEELKAKILALADRADIPAKDVYEVDMSKKTNQINAYVNGIGANARIVLWDTLLKRMNENEVLHVMAHEMGHYVKKHVYLGLVLGLFGIAFFLWILSFLLPRVIRQWGRRWNVFSMKELSSLPVILLLFYTLSFAALPINNVISRSIEQSADVYALEMLNDPDVAISTYQKLAKVNASYPNPPWMVKIYMYTHPTLAERIEYAYHAGSKK